MTTRPRTRAPLTIPDENASLRERLTELRVERLKSNPAGRYYVMDDGKDAVRGFGVIVYPTGQRVFFLRFRTRGTRKTSRERRLKIGTYPELSVKHARESAGRVKGERDTGNDPAEDRKREKNAPAVRAVFPAYFTYLRNAVKVKPRTLDEYERQLRLHILPAIGARKVTEVRQDDVAKLHGETLKDRPYMANRVLALLAAFFRWTERAEGGKLRQKDSNPCERVTWHPEEARESTLEGEELQRLGDALIRALDEGLPPAPTRRAAAEQRNAKRREQTAAAHRTGKASTAYTRGAYRPTDPATRMPVKANPYAIAAIRFLVLTGWRENEALSLRWSAVNLDASRVNLKRTKSGQSHRTLSAPAVEVLARLPRLADSPYCFPSARDAQKPLTDIAHVWQAVRHAAGLDSLRLHDLRHNFASYGASALYNLPVISKLLGHRDLASTQRYAHLSDASVLRAAESIGGDIAAKLAGRETPITAIDSRRAERATHGQVSDARGMLNEAY